MEKKEYSAGEFDPIDRQELAEKHGINFNKLMYLLDTGELCAYDRNPGKLKTVYPSMAPERYEKISGIKPPDPNEFPEEGLEIKAERKAVYRRLTSNEVGGLTREAVKHLYFSRAEVENLTSEKAEKNEPSYSALQKSRLRLHVREMVRDGHYRSKDDLFRDPVVQSILSDKQLDWDKDTILRYTQRLGIPEKKRGPKKRT